MLQKIKICSFNLRCDTADDGINQFSKGRCNRVLELIENEAPDIIGFQEMTSSMFDFMRDALREYMVFGCGRDKDYGGESTAVAVKKQGFRVISYDTFWLSYTPNVPGSTFGADQSHCPRTATALLIHKDGCAENFRVVNTHLDHVGERAKSLGIAAVIHYISKFPEKFVLTGDFNSIPESSVIATVNGVMHEGRKVKNLTEYVGGTYHDYGQLQKPEKIDYIFSDADYISEGSKLVAYPPVDGVYVSDHHPVFATIIIE